MKTTGPNHAASDDFHAIIHIITNLIDVDKIYCIDNSGTSSHKGLKQAHCEHIELLVITASSLTVDVLAVQEAVNESLEIKTAVILLVHTRDHVDKALKQKNRFFIEIFNGQQLIYQKEDLAEGMDVPKYDKDKALANAMLFWYHRQQRAEALLVAAANITEQESSIVEAWLLNQAMEQVCLGFIFVNIGYRPNQLTLSYLFDICRGIDPVIDKVFPTKRTEDKAIFNLLITASGKMRHQVLVDLQPTDLTLLRRRCSSWLDKATEIVESELGRQASSNL